MVPFELEQGVSVEMDRGGWAVSIEVERGGGGYPLKWSCIFNLN